MDWIWDPTKSKSMTKSDENLICSVPQALACTDRICSSINVGSTKTGINMDAVRLCGEIVKKTADATKENELKIQALERAKRKLDNFMFDM